MKPTNITYSKVFSLGNFENEKIGIEIELEEGEDITNCMQQARKFVDFNHKVNGVYAEIAKCEKIINSPDDFTGGEIKNAKLKLENLHKIIEDGNKLLQQSNP